MLVCWRVWCFQNFQLYCTCLEATTKKNSLPLAVPFFKDQQIRKQIGDSCGYDILRKWNMAMDKFTGLGAIKTSLNQYIYIHNYTHIESWHMKKNISIYNMYINIIYCICTIYIIYNIYIHTLYIYNIYIYIYIHIYISIQSMCIYVYMCIHIYTYMYIYNIYMYVYTYIVCNICIHIYIYNMYIYRHIYI